MHISPSKDVFQCLICAVYQDNAIAKIYELVQLLIDVISLMQLFSLVLRFAYHLYLNVSSWLSCLSAEI